MKGILSKLNFLAIFTFGILFLASCNGTTSIHGIEHRTKSKTHKKSFPKYDVKVKSRNSHKGLPPGQHKKIHGDKSAKKYAPGQNKYKGKKHVNKSHKKHHHGKKGHK